MTFLTFIGGQVFAAEKTQENKVTMLKEVVVTAEREKSEAYLQPGGIGRVIVIDVENAPSSITRLDDLLIEAGIMSGNATNSLGISSGISARGFSVLQQNSTLLTASKVFLNGHPDIAWRFSRDSSTVSTVEVVAGHDATFWGASSPGASINYNNKQPEGHEFKRINLGLGSNNAKRLVVDTETHFGSMQLRSVLAIQRDDMSVEKVQDERNVGLLSAKLPTDLGDFKVEAEYHQLKMPYVFGTAYLADRFWFDKSYVDERADANRQYYRGGLYWQKKSSDGLIWSAYAQKIRSTRQETLLGWYDIKNAEELNGYYRLADEKNKQSDVGIKLQGEMTTLGVRHDWALLVQQHEQNRKFNGPQNIGGFTLDLESPVFPSNLSSLKLDARYAFDSYKETGIGFSDKLVYDSWEMRLGFRNSSMQFDRTTNKNTAPVRETKINHTSAALGLSYRLNAENRIWFSNTQSFQPNRGNLRSGEYLAPSKGQQTEIGWEYQDARKYFSMSYFDIKQSNLPGVDPVDKDASVLIGANRSFGLEFNTTLKTDFVKFGTTVTLLKARVVNPTSVDQGAFLVGTPSAYGAVHLTFPLVNRYEASTRLVFASSRPGDDVASFKAPGYGVLNLSVKSPRMGSFRWGAEISNALDKRYARAISGADNVWQGSRRTFRGWIEADFF